MSWIRYWVMVVQRWGIDIMAVSKIVREAVDIIAKAFNDSADSAVKIVPSESPLPKMSDLQSFRNTNQFRIAKENMRPEITQKLSQGMPGSVKLSDSAIDSEVASIFDNEVFSSFPNSDYWDDFSVKEVESMVDELKAMPQLPNDDIPDFFSELGNANEETLDLVDFILNRRSGD